MGRAGRSLGDVAGHAYLDGRGAVSWHQMTPGLPAFERGPPGALGRGPTGGWGADQSPSPESARVPEAQRRGLLLPVPAASALPVGRWVESFARSHGGFDVELGGSRDLRPAGPSTRPHHPRLRKYEEAHTQAWSRQRGPPADAFVFVTPEYNYLAPRRPS